MNAFREILQLVNHVSKRNVDGYLFFLENKLIFSQIDCFDPAIQNKIVIHPKDLPKTMVGKLLFAYSVARKASEYPENKQEPLIIEQWKTEGDFFEIQSANYHFIVSRSPILGSLFGYVGISKNHVYFGKSDDEIYNLKCHGGITYIGNELPFMNQSFWYFGFDCAHDIDYSPKINFNLSKEYRNVSYVMEENKMLFNQLEELNFNRSKTGINLKKKEQIHF